jgi:hypothetical protein
MHMPSWFLTTVKEEPVFAYEQNGWRHIDPLTAKIGKNQSASIGKSIQIRYADAIGICFIRVLKQIKTTKLVKW